MGTTWPKRERLGEPRAAGSRQMLLRVSGLSQNPVRHTCMLAAKARPLISSPGSLKDQTSAIRDARRRTGASSSQRRPFIERLDIATADQFEMFSGNAHRRPLSARDLKSDSFLQDFFDINERVKCFLPGVVLQASTVHLGDGFGRRARGQNPGAVL